MKYFLMFLTILLTTVVKADVEGFYKEVNSFFPNNPWGDYQMLPNEEWSPWVWGRAGHSPDNPPIFSSQAHAQEFPPTTGHPCVPNWFDCYSGLISDLNARNDCAGLLNYAFQLRGLPEPATKWRQCELFGRICFNNSTVFKEDPNDVPPFPFLSVEECEAHVDACRNFRPVIQAHVMACEAGLPRPIFPPIVPTGCGDFLDGPGGELWKPVSDNTGRPVFLLDESDRNLTHQLLDNSGAFAADVKFRTCCPNGGRAHFDILKSCQELQKLNLPLLLQSSDGSCRVVPDPCVRYD